MLTPDSVLLFDVMSTLVYDPFPTEMLAFFGLTLPQMTAQRHPTAWVDFESGKLGEDEFYEIFLAGDPMIDGDAMRRMLQDTYCYIPGMEELLGSLKAQGVPMHAVSNYPVWFELIEQKLGLSRYLDHAFVSHDMGVRKPAPQAYVIPAETLGVRPSDCIFVDDREANCAGARGVGMRAVRFESAPHLARALGMCREGAA